MRTIFKVKNILLFCFLGAVISCSHPQASSSSKELPPIFPDYIGVTVPSNIAPLNFEVKDATHISATIKTSNGETYDVDGTTAIEIPASQWSEILASSKGKDINVSVSVWDAQHPQGVTYKDFSIHISPDPIDNWVAYRLIPPGYEGWRFMGIYQREMSSFKVEPIIENSQNNDGCVNCHSFADYSPEHFMFHARGKNGGTIIYDHNKLEKLAIEKIGPQKGASYNIWHPSGKFIAFSSNATRQSFYSHSRDKIEVYDLGSDLIIYDVQKHDVIADERFNDSINWETFPAFSPDGKYLYFSTAKGVRMPMECPKLHYSIVRVPFNADGTLGAPVDTIYSCSQMGGSALMPRISPDGNFMLFTWAENGAFHVYHKEADFKMMDLRTRTLIPIPDINSNDSESYHSWSSNGKWVMFASKRSDTRYTRLYFSHWDGKRFSKPFILPQEIPAKDVELMYSYNIPEFIKSPVNIDKDKLADLFKQ